MGVDSCEVGDGVRGSRFDVGAEVAGYGVGGGGVGWGGLGGDPRSTQTPPEQTPQGTELQGVPSGRFLGGGHIPFALHLSTISWQSEVGWHKHSCEPELLGYVL